MVCHAAAAPGSCSWKQINTNEDSIHSTSDDQMSLPPRSVLALIFVLIDHVVSESSNPDVSTACETCHNQPSPPENPSYGVPPPPPQGYPIYGAPPPPPPQLPPPSPPAATQGSCPPGQVVSCCRLPPPPPVPFGYGPPSPIPFGYGPPNPYVPIENRSSSFPSLFLCFIMMLLLLLVK